MKKHTKKGDDNCDIREEEMALINNDSIYTIAIFKTDRNIMQIYFDRRIIEEIAATDWSTARKIAEQAAQRYFKENAEKFMKLTNEYCALLQSMI